MELSPEDRKRIYKEEKVKEPTSKSSKKVLVTIIAIALFGGIGWFTYNHYFPHYNGSLSHTIVSSPDLLAQWMQDGSLVHGGMDSQEFRSWMSTEVIKYETAYPEDKVLCNMNLDKASRAWLNN